MPEPTLYCNALSTPVRSHSSTKPFVSLRKDTSTWSSGLNPPVLLHRLSAQDKEHLLQLPRPSKPPPSTRWGYKSTYACSELHELLPAFCSHAQRHSQAGQDPADTATGLRAAAAARGGAAPWKDPYVLWPGFPFVPSRGWLVELTGWENAGRPLTLRSRCYYKDKALMHNARQRTSTLIWHVEETKYFPYLHL